MDLNSVNLVGNVVNNAVVNYTCVGIPYIKITLAVTRMKKINQETADIDYFTVTSFGKKNENLYQYLIRGKKIAVSGRLQQDKWCDSNSQTHYSVSIVAENIQLF